MKRPATTLALTVALCLPLASGMARAADGDHPDLNGTWIINEELSEDPRQKMREARQGMGGRGGKSGMRGGMGGGRGGMGAGGGGGMGRPGGGDRPDPEEMRARMEERMKEFMASSQSMTIVHEDPELRITFADGRERTLYSDGREVMELTARGDEKTEAKWKKGKLAVKRKRQDGRRITETWEYSGAYMTVTVEVKSGGRGPSFSVKRVYEHAEIADSPEHMEGAAAQDPDGSH